MLRLPRRHAVLRLRRARSAEWIGGCGHDLGEARATLLADGVLIAGYAIAAGGILRRWWPLYQAPRLKRRERLVVALPFITAALDVAENIATWSALGSDEESLHLSRQPLRADAGVDARLAEDARLRCSGCSASPPSACWRSPAATSRRVRSRGRTSRSPCASYRHRPTSGCAAPAEASAPPPSPSARSTNSNGPA